LPVYVFGPSITQLRRVPCASGMVLNSVVHFASHGLMKCRSIVTESGATPMISMRPSPAFLLPLQWYFAPIPLGGPLCSRFMSGSSCSHGLQCVHFRKSTTCARMRLFYDISKGLLSFLRHEELRAWAGSPLVSPPMAEARRSSG